MKNSSLWIRTAIIVVITLIGIYLVFGPRGSVSGEDFTWSGIKENLAQNINLGLDLRGGSHLVMRVKTEKYLKDLTENNQTAALLAAQEAQLPVSDASYIAENGNYQVTLNVTDPSKNDEIIEAVRKKVDFSVWNQSTSGNSIIWTLPNQAQKLLKEQATDQAMKIIDGRINAFGVKEPLLQRQGASDSGQILLQMPGVDDPERIKKLIGAESRLALMKIVSPPNPSPVQTYPTKEAAEQSIAGAPNRRVMVYADRDEMPTANQQNPPDKPKQFVVVETPAVVDGSELRDAQAVSRTGNDSDYQISFSFKPGGAQKFGEWTGKNIGNYMAVVLNDEVKSAAYIKSQIFDSGEISGRFSKTTAEDLALTLKSGALPAEIEYQEERTVGPSLGADSIESGVEASIGGLVLVILFMLFYYRGAGVNAVIALLLNLLLTIGGLIVLDSTLTLPGIAGLILGIGMAVDSNVLIFERIREELRAGFDVRKAIDLGFDRAFITIIDTHITTIISSIILYLYGSGPIRGFAVTLILGLLINLFSAVFVSRTIFMWLLERNPNMKKLSV
ncbi:MAG: protein translocase subunit SecD [Acidobacteria bacterium]|jgi:preprotein translocase subunit SecD|nr:protein translocase subunit SecD [Acidobacteriota bacterium]